MSKIKFNPNVASIAFIAITILAFVAYKLTSLSFRFGDHNLYFLYANQILHGWVPHLDYFQTDTPVFAAVLAFVRLIAGNHLLVLQALPIFFHVLTAIMLYLIARRWRNPAAFLVPAFYLFTFSILANSDYPTGEELAILASVIALWFWTRERYAASGIAWSVACLVKIYLGAAFLLFLIFVMICSGRKSTGKLLLGFLPLPILILAPLAIINFSKLWYDLVIFHLQRTAVISKVAIFQYFWLREWLLLVFALPGFYILRKRPVFWPLLGLLLFFFAFHDLYYLYLQPLVPYLALAAAATIGWVMSYPRSLPYAFSLIFLYLFFIAISVNFYHHNWFNRGRILNVSEMVSVIKQLPEQYPLYGSYEITPLLSLLSGRPLYKNYFDTNVQSFAIGRLDREAISAEMVFSGVYLVARISDLPQYNIRDYGYQDYFSPDIFARACHRAAEFPSTAQDWDTAVVVYGCKNP